MITTVNELLKSEYLMFGLRFFQFKSNWLNSVDSLNMELLYNDHFHLTGGKGMNYWEKKLLTFTFI